MAGPSASPLSKGHLQPTTKLLALAESFHPLMLYPFLRDGAIILSHRLLVGKDAVFEVPRLSMQQLLARPSEIPLSIPSQVRVSAFEKLSAQLKVN